MGSNDRPPSFDESQAEAAQQGSLAAPRRSLSALSIRSSQGNGASPSPGPSSERQGANGGDRNWDDPPDHEPSGPPEPDLETTMILVEKHQLKPPEHRLGIDIQHVAFSPSGAYVAAQTRHGNEDWSTVQAWNAATLKPVSFPYGQQPTVRGRFALSPGPEHLVACDSPVPEAAGLGGRGEVGRRTRLETFDLAAAKRRVAASSLPVASPLAWSPDGTLVAGVSAHDTSRIYVVKARAQLLAGAVPHHIDAVTHLAFAPDGASLVSLSRDGSCKITSLATGRVLHKYEVETRHNPRALRVSRDGATVAAVWGRDVMVWTPASGAMATYNLSAVRHSEGAALAISPDCEYLACRSEDGFDVLDLRTGRFRAEVRTERSFVTTAAFSHDGRWLVVGKHNGEVMIYLIVVAEPQPSK